MWPQLLYSDLPYHIISTPTRPYTGDFGDSHGDFGDFTYPNSSLLNPTTPKQTHPYPDLPYHTISTPTRPYNGDFGDSHGDFGGDFGDFGFSGDPSACVASARFGRRQALGIRRGALIRAVRAHIVERTSGVFHIWP